MNYLADCKRNGQPCVVSMSWAELVQVLCTHVAGVCACTWSQVCGVSTRRDETRQTARNPLIGGWCDFSKSGESMWRILHERKIHTYILFHSCSDLLSMCRYLLLINNIYNLNPQYGTAKQDVNKIYRIGCVAMRTQQPTTRLVVTHAKYVRFTQVHKYSFFFFVGFLSSKCDGLNYILSFSAGEWTS